MVRQVSLEMRPVFGTRLRSLNRDFIAWSAPSKRRKLRPAFDCIVMNPPFAARTSMHIKLDLAQEIPSVQLGLKYLPIEAAFTLRAVSILKPNGRLLAIVPASIISSRKLSWLRRYLLQLGSVRYVHELPPFTFKEVEAKVYLFVYEKHAKQRTVVLCNHDVRGTARIALAKTTLLEEGRFDYAFYKALRWHTGLRRAHPDLGWTALEDVVKIYRGRAESPVEGKALHTCDYNDGFWDTKKRSDRLQKDKSICCIRRGDLLVKRVGRHCASSIGKVIGHLRTRCSDCVLIIRPQKISHSMDILFSLRVLLASPESAALVEQGAGASYLTTGQLLNLSIPVKLALRYPRTFSRYRRAVWRKNFTVMTEVENRVRKIISRVCVT